MTVRALHRVVRDVDVVHELDRLGGAFGLRPSTSGQDGEHRERKEDSDRGCLHGVPELPFRGSTTLSRRIDGDASRAIDADSPRGQDLRKYAQSTRRVKGGSSPPEATSERFREFGLVWLDESLVVGVRDLNCVLMRPRIERDLLVFLE